MKLNRQPKPKFNLLAAKKLGAIGCYLICVGLFIKAYTLAQASPTENDNLTALLYVGSALLFWVMGFLLKERTISTR